MKQSEEQVTIKKLEPREGYVLTQNTDVDIKDRSFSSIIYLSNLDSVDNYKEITIEEAKALKTEQDRLIKETLNI